MAAKEEKVFNNTPKNKTQLLSSHPISGCNTKSIVTHLHSNDYATAAICLRLFVSERTYSGLMAQLEAVVYSEASTV